MYKCRECDKETEGVLLTSPEGESIYVCNLCKGCVWNLEDIPNLDDEPTLRCKDCECSTYMLVNKRCHECHVVLLEFIDDMPKCEPIDPPLGHNLIGADDILAEMEMMDAYNKTPQKGELEN